MCKPCQPRVSLLYQMLKVKVESCQLQFLLLHGMVSRLKGKASFLFRSSPSFNCARARLWKPKCLFRGTLIRISSFSRDLSTTLDRQQLGERSAVPPSTGLEAPRQSLELLLQQPLGVLIVSEGLSYVSHLSWLTNEVPSDLGVCKKNIYFFPLLFFSWHSSWVVSPWASCKHMERPAGCPGQELSLHGRSWRHYWRKFSR